MQMSTMSGLRLLREPGALRDQPRPPAVARPGDVRMGLRHRNFVTVHRGALRRAAPARTWSESSLRWPLERPWAPRSPLAAGAGTLGR